VGAGHQDDAAEPVLAPVQALVGQQPCATVLDNAADGAEPRTVRRAHLADARLDAVLQAEPAVVGAVVACIGVQPAEGGADDLRQTQEMREEPRVVDVGRRRDDGQRNAVGRDRHVIFGAGLAPVGGIGAGQLAAALGPDRTAVHDHIPCRDRGPRAHHADQDNMDLAQHGRGMPVVQPPAQGGAGRTPNGRPQVSPLHTRADEEPQRLDHLDGRHGWSSGAKRPGLDLIDDPRHQGRRARCHARLPVLEAPETDTRSADVKAVTTRPGL
jgi:hypothetical protein